MAIADNKLKDIESKVDTTPDIADTDVVDIDLSVIQKKKFRIDGDNSRILELNPTDISIITRIEEADKKFSKCVEDLEKLTEAPSDTEEEIVDLGKKFKDIDNQMRNLLDYVFQSNVSEICVPEGSGSMYDPVNGKFRYDHILETLLALYQTNIQAEFKQMHARINNKTAKYTKKKR